MTIRRNKSVVVGIRIPEISHTFKLIREKFRSFKFFMHESDKTYWTSYWVQAPGESDF